MDSVPPDPDAGSARDGDYDVNKDDYSKEETEKWETQRLWLIQQLKRRPPTAAPFRT